MAKDSKSNLDQTYQTSISRNRNTHALGHPLIQRPLMPFYIYPLDRHQQQSYTSKLKQLSDNDDYEFGREMFAEESITYEPIDFQSGAELYQIFAPFRSLIETILLYVEVAITMHREAEHNRRICSALLKRLTAAKSSVEMLELLKNERIDFFTKENYNIFWRFQRSIEKIRNFMRDISQIKGIRKFKPKYLDGYKSIEETFEELTTEFDGYMKSLNFTIALPEDVQSQKDKDALKQDKKELLIYLETIQGGITTDRKEISENIEVVSTLVELFQQQATQSHFSKSQQISVQQVLDEPELDLKDFTAVLSNKKKVQRRKLIKDQKDVAWREIGSKTLNPTLLHTQVIILKKLQDSTNIIKYHGLAEESGKRYLVTEWAEYGNLKDFYTQRGPMDWKRKFDFAIGICRGLSYLRAVGIIHYDIRPENILITSQTEAKIANYGFMRNFNESSQGSSSSFRNMAPEKLSNPAYQTDFRCEIYSLGMVLWEIAEERVPLTNIRSTQELIAKVVKENYREKLSPNKDVPKEWKKVYESAIHKDPEFRPTISEIFNALFPVWRRLKKELTSTKKEPTKEDAAESTESTESTPPKLVSVGMTVSEAIAEHKKKSTDRKEIFECFSEYNELGDINAKYWKGYYLYYNILEVDDENKEERLQNAASLFREAAEYDIPEAQLRYGHCLWRGDGIEKNTDEAIIYFQKAAVNGNHTAMYNIGNIYYNGIGAEKDAAKGEYWLRMAAYSGQPKAVEMCKSENIAL
ncbi:6989_t:CDS:2 [Ambispora gerdemannii]|uniref:6989_t:CDS:1 n=1 Tax=Ambispora gerdemannii TaxID=144530 RepID=A0A9N9ABV4_9GLOM|nr:6989_t:CDS:2 [Ambispora gerdemannii]